jgi:hypothetical protein
MIAPHHEGAHKIRGQVIQKPSSIQELDTPEPHPGPRVFPHKFKRGGQSIADHNNFKMLDFRLREGYNRV